MSEETKEVGRMKDRLRKLLSRQNMSESELKAFNLKRAQSERERTQSQLAAMMEPDRQAYYEERAQAERYFHSTYLFIIWLYYCYCKLKIFF